MSIHIAQQYKGVGAWPIRISLALSEKAYFAEIKRLGINDTEKFIGRDVGGAVVHLKELQENGRACHDQVVICIDLASRRKTHTKLEILSILVHEATHAWQYTKASAGEVAPGDETEAYFMQHLTYWLFEQVDKAMRGAA